MVGGVPGLPSNVEVDGATMKKFVGNKIFWFLVLGAGGVRKFLPDYNTKPGYSMSSAQLGWELSVTCVTCTRPSC